MVGVGYKRQRPAFFEHTTTMSSKRQRLTCSDQIQSAPAAMAASPTADTTASHAVPPQTAPLRSTPHTNRARAHHPYASTHLENVEPYHKLADEMRGRYKLYTIEDFLNLLPATNEEMPEPDYHALSVLDEASAKLDMYALFVSRRRSTQI